MRLRPRSALRALARIAMHASRGSWPSKPPGRWARVHRRPPRMTSEREGRAVLLLPRQRGSGAPKHNTGLRAARRNGAQSLANATLVAA